MRLYYLIHVDRYVLLRRDLSIGSLPLSRKRCESDGRCRSPLSESVSREVGERGNGGEERRHVGRVRKGEGRHGKGRDQHRRGTRRFVKNDIGSRGQDPREAWRRGTCCLVSNGAVRGNGRGSGGKQGMEGECRDRNTKVASKRSLESTFPSSERSPNDGFCLISWPVAF
jgi:hypothetical protein